ncbi:G-type lectin S-receptor-like serine/threonine-protein kinase At4g27290 [Apium graveolens]|uniref:G-type lectin S-receptor-like serine/threonine-protein kinase At4g27290 n=1 Tax=Apium graveolens TaxID=4045 RepID=UPI003D7A8E20
MWYRISSSTVIWVANREIPINSTSGVLKLTTSGTLNIFRNTSDLTPIWSSNASFSVQNPVAELRENGNFVIREENDDNPVSFFWQSFDHPTDTLFSGMKLGKNFVTGQEWYLSCWKNSDDPAQGEYTYRLDPTGYPHNVIMKGQNLTFQTGAWNGVRFSGRPKSSGNTMYTHKVVINKEEVYYMFEQINSSVSRLMINQSGKGQRWTWLQQAQKWSILYEVPSDNCDNYNICGAYGDCNINNGPVCGCLEKFVPIDVDAWTKGDWGSGCTRKKPLDCQKGDGFRKYSHIKEPDTLSTWIDERINLKECKKSCLRNCSCMAYASLNISKGETGCLQWFGDLKDIREVSEGGADLFIRVAFSDSDREKNKATFIISLSVVGGVCLLGLPLAFCIWKIIKKKSKLKRSKGILQGSPKGILRGSSKEHSNMSQKEDPDLPYFSLTTLLHATNNFANSNKIGQGGFGPVFKGILEDGQQVAVKCLSETSTQGTNEFMNEVKFIAKLQHRNLVRLLGYCTDEENKMLIYEYMPNKSLDWHIFNEFRNKLLDWPKRFHIIDGIARGLLYLHQDSRLRIVHRDLKASNILLDVKMDAKISDFGTARSFRENETTASTNQLAGTFGYMPPEYALDGILSVKSDVFSFGVLALETVCGKRNREFIHSDHLQHLSGHAWRLHREGRTLELVHQNISQESDYALEMIRTIHIALLCVQQSREERPDMATVVLMLGSNGELPMPSQPGFFTEGNIVGSDADDNTLLEGR